MCHLPVCSDEVKQEDLTQYLSHPAVTALHARLTALLSPSMAAGDAMPLLDCAHAPGHATRGATDAMRRGARSGAVGGAAGWDAAAASVLAVPTSARAGTSGWDAAAVVALAAASLKARPPPDPWVGRAARLSRAGWGQEQENFVRRLFLGFMSSLLKGYHQFLPATAVPAGGAGAAAAGPGPAMGARAVNGQEKSSPGGGAGHVGPAQASLLHAPVPRFLMQGSGPSGSAQGPGGPPGSPGSRTQPQLLMLQGGREGQVPSSPTRGRSVASMWMPPGVGGGGSFSHPSHHGALPIVKELTGGQGVTPVGNGCGWFAWLMYCGLGCASAEPAWCMHGPMHAPERRSRAVQRTHGDTRVQRKQRKRLQRHGPAPEPKCDQPLPCNL